MSHGSPSPGILSWVAALASSHEGQLLLVQKNPQSRDLSEGDILGLEQDPLSVPDVPFGGTCRCLHCGSPESFSFHGSLVLQVLSVNYLLIFI